MLGRRRSFDKSEVLDRLMNVFWKKGYAGTSMSDLTSATGLTKPSLYAAYGNKEAMYCAALDCYVQLQSEDVYATLAEDELGWAEALTNFLKATARAATRPNRPAGCFVSVASCDAQAGALPDETVAFVGKINSQGKQMLVEAFSAQLGTGIRGSFDPEVLADYVLVLQAGLVQMAVRGTGYAALERTIETAICGLVAGTVRQEAAN